MKFVLPFLLSVLSVSVFGQCKVEADAFTGKKTVKFSFKNETLVYELVDEKPTMEIKFNYAGEFNTIVKMGAEMMVKTDSDQIIKWTTTKDAAPVSSIIGYNVYSSYTYSFTPTKEDLEKMAGSKLTMMRYPDGKDGQTDLEFKGSAKKWGKAMVEGAQCLLENL